MPGSVSHALTSTLDIVPTIAKLAGVALPTDRTFDGMLGYNVFWLALGWLRLCAAGSGTLGVVILWAG